MKHLFGRILSLPSHHTSLKPSQWPVVVQFCIGAITVLVCGCLAYVFYLHQRDGRENLRDGHYEIAYDYYFSRAQTGDSEAQNTLANLYMLGLGVPQSRPLAAHWYLKAALTGHVPAQINLGQLYWNGLGVPRHVEHSVGWFYLAKMAGSEHAEAHLDYIGRTNSILPLMYDEAVLKYSDLKTVNERFKKLGEAAFLGQ